MRRLRSLSPVPYAHAVPYQRPQEISNPFAHFVNSHTQVHESIHGVHLRPRQSRMLVQPPTVLVRDAFSVLNVQCDDADLVGVTVVDMVR